MKPTAELPRPIRKEIASLALKLRRQYKALFASDPLLRKRVGQFLAALLPPKPRRRGRPGRKDVTQAIRLRVKLHHLYPEEKYEEIWKLIYLLVIRGYEGMHEVEKKDARERLRDVLQTGSRGLGRVIR